MIETATWDPPPRRPGWAKAYIGASLGLVTTLVVTVGGIRGLNAATETRYAEKPDVCGALETGPLERRLGVPSSQPEKGLLPSVCDYAMFDAGRRQGAGRLTINRFASSFEASLSWEVEKTDDERITDVPGLGREARIATVDSPSPGIPICSAHLHVLDANAMLMSQISVAADLGSHPCDDLEALKAALIDSTRATMAHFA
ncbi:hypothetical protein ACQP2X_23010 [Actinoplanes sp. CA-131856]